eukprot:1871175-Rhodomonas_salina.1
MISDHRWTDQGFGLLQRLAMEAIGVRAQSVLLSPPVRGACVRVFAAASVLCARVFVFCRGVVGERVCVCAEHAFARRGTHHNDDDDRNILTAERA